MENVVEHLEHSLYRVITSLFDNYQVVWRVGSIQGFISSFLSLTHRSEKVENGRTMRGILELNHTHTGHLGSGNCSGGKEEAGIIDRNRDALMSFRPPSSRLPP